MNLPRPDEELLSVKELAARLKRSEGYVKRMKALGFQMPAGRTTLRLAIVWIVKHGPPCRRMGR